MRKEEEIRKWVEILEKERENQRPFYRTREYCKKSYKTSLAMGLGGG